MLSSSFIKIGVNIVNKITKSTNSLLAVGNS